jgi:MFS-type transporter involved in bile tolerance (Atg22 family)
VVLAPLGRDLEAEARAAGAVGAVAALLLGVACWRALPQEQAWLPQALPLLPAAQRLAPPADWRTTLVVTAFVFIWVLPVQLWVPQLMR